jgi:signal transduction histidine kinase/serine/threonine protein kinase/CheY-like chemotaxis protein
MGPADVSIPGVEVLDELGHGAHSTVYRVRHRGRHYALKVPRQSNLDAGAVVASRFVREAVALARVRHPALPQVMEVGQSGQLPYIVMELVAGETLAERLRRGPLAEDRVIDLGIQLADALAKIHEAGLVHRDVKPQNILFDSLNTAVRLVDFGFAETSAATTLTLSPLSRALQDHADPGGDLQGLGAVLFQCATAIAPFGEVDLRPLLERSGERPDLPSLLAPALARILKRLLLPEERRGYPDARALADDLRTLLASRRVRSTDPLATFDSHGATSAPPLFGRQREIDRLESALRASTLSHSQIVVVRGPSGSGKSRLTRAFLDRVGGTARHWAATCEQSQREPLAVVRKLIELQLDEYDERPHSDRLRAIARFRELAADVSPLLRLLSARISHTLRTGTIKDSNQLPAVISDEAVAEFLAQLLHEGPHRIVLVDDVQWLDAGSRRVLGYLSSSNAPRVLFIFSGRDDTASWPAFGRLLRSLEMARIWELVLDPLDEEQTAELIKSYLGVDQLNEDLFRYVMHVADGTPLGTMQVVHSMLEAGALVPYWGTWQFDLSTASRLELPKGSLELLALRIRNLDERSVGILTTAAVIGREFELKLLARASATDAEQVADVLGEACRSMLVEALLDGYRFTHDSVREALLTRLSREPLQHANQVVAEAIDAAEGIAPGPAPTSHLRLHALNGDGWLGIRDAGALGELEASAARQSFRLATHYAEGQPAKSPQRTLMVCFDAGLRSFETYDNDLALRFFVIAKHCAEILGVDLGVQFELTRAEALMRTGSLTEGIECLTVVCARAVDPVVRAQAFSRIAWAEAQIDVDRAWQALFEGFRALGVRPPEGNLAGLIQAPWGLFARIFRRRRPASAADADRIQVLCQLYNQTARLGVDSGKPLRFLESVVPHLRQAERLGSSAALSNAYLSCSFALTAFGMRSAGRRLLAAAEAAAQAARDPAVYARSLQVHAVIAAWAGNLLEATHVGARSLEEYGHWREISEYCLTAYSQQQIEGVRGRNLEAWKWLDHALTKLGKHEGPALALEFVELSVRAALTALGRASEAASVLTRLANLATRPPTRGAVVITSYGSRVRLYTESGNLGEDFEALVQEVRDLGLNPKRVHLAAIEYYVHVAHARAHACLRAKPSELPRKLELLLEAQQELDLAARVPLFKAHALAIAGYVAFFRGNFEKARASFDAAERLGASEAAPWVLYAVHRGRAHLLRAEGLPEAVNDQALLAAALAREHGAAFRERWIREEFDLRAGRSGGSSDASPLSPFAARSLELDGPRSRPRPRGYLRSLVQIGQQSTRDVAIEEQARLVVGELIDATRAERGFLLLMQSRLDAEDGPAGDSPNESSGPSELVLVAAQDAAGRELHADLRNETAFVNDTITAGFPGSDETILPNVVTLLRDDRAVIATALSLRGERIGAVYLDRPTRAGVFTDSEARTLSALVLQAPLVFELARFLRARERAEETQRGTEKLEAIGRLAGGIAHDFNNMLSVILGVTDQILTQRSSRSVPEDVKTVQSAAERARDLTRQLLAFSRGQYLRPEILSLNDLVERLEPILRQLLGSDVQLSLQLQDGLGPVRADPAQLDQVLTNLVVNARDAMPGGGELVIRTEGLILESGREAQKLALPPGRYVKLVVRDTGAGMDAPTLAKAFEPFFTTKPTGSGLGLPTAYGIVKQSGGHIDIESRQGAGTTFRILLPETEQRASVPVPAPAASDRPGTGTVLLVDDEPLVREATRRTLRSLGYQVLGAKSADEALRIAAENVDSIDLVITDVMMPGMNGLELARELGKIRPSLKVLFISGYTAGVLAERGFLNESVNFLQKPVAREQLSARLRELLNGQVGQ